MDLASGRVLVVDCQSTGATPAQGALLELGWASTRPDRRGEIETAAHLIALPEGTHIPRAVARITGITVDDLGAAVSAEQAWSSLSRAAVDVDSDARGTPTVIHYASFERRWLGHLHAQFTPEAPFPLQIVCAHQIARRVLADLPRRGIRALAGYFGFPVEMLRRCAGHVAATAFVWRHLVGELAEHDVRTWAELARWLEETPAASSKKRGFPVDRARRLALPDQPGIYRMVRRGGVILYVGKATSLRRRVNSYFTKQRGVHERTMEMLAQAREIAVTVTATPLEAALLETDEIKRHRPPYNVQLLEDERSVWFAAADLADATPEPDERHRVGPLPSRWSLRAYSALRALLAGEADGDRGLIARAVVAGRGPDEACFTRGVNRFVVRYRLRLPGQVDAALLQLSKHLAALQARGEFDEGEPRQDDGWDPDRVARHLERVVLGTGQLMRRSRWLRLLSEASVGWHEPGEPARRVIVIERGQLTRSAYAATEAALPVPPGASRSDAERRRCFDIATYDRLRVLTTELKRITADSEAEVRLGPHHQLTGAALRRVLMLC